MLAILRAHSRTLERIVGLILGKPLLQINNKPHSCVHMIVSSRAHKKVLLAYRPSCPAAPACQVRLACAANQHAAHWMTTRLCVNGKMTQRVTGNI